MVSSAEIDAHKELLQAHLSNIPLSECAMAHRLTQNEGFGPMIFVEFRFQEKLVQVVPVTMLSVLEANGYANETLSLIYDAELIENVDDRRLALDSVKTQYSRWMDSATLTEYTLFLHLANRHFPELELKQRLRLVSSLMRLTLNLDMYQMSRAANVLESTFFNTPDGAALSMDMRRSSSRPVFAFKAILLMYGYIQHMNEEDNIAISESFALDAFNALEQFLVKIQLFESTPLEETEFYFFLEKLSEDVGLLDHIIIPKSAKLNRPLLKAQTSAEAFPQLTLVDFRMHNSGRLMMPKRIDLEVREFPRGVKQTIGKLERLYKRSNPAKEGLHKPHAAVVVRHAT